MKKIVLFSFALFAMCFQTTRAEWVDNYWMEIYHGDTLYFDVFEEDYTARLEYVGLQITTNHLYIPQTITVLKEYQDDYGQMQTRTIVCSVTRLQPGFYVGGQPYSTGSWGGEWHFPVDTVTIPSSVMEGKIAAENIIFEGTIAQWNSITGGFSADISYFSGYNLYINGTMVTNLTIPSGIDSIYDNAFSCCKSITSIAIPNSLSYIGAYAFSNCYNLQSITIEPGSYMFSDYVFPRAESYPVPHGIREIHFTGTINQWATRNWKRAVSSSPEDYGANDVMLDGYEMYDTLDDGSVSEWNTTRQGYKLYIGESLLTDCIITADTIRPYAFYNCASLQSVTITASVQAIFDEAFNRTPNIKILNLPENIPSLMFYRWEGDGMHSYAAPSDTLHPLFGRPNSLIRISYAGSMEDWLENGWFRKVNAFKGTPGFASSDTSTFALYLDGTLLEDCELPTSITSIPDYAFQTCNIRSLTVPDNIDTIGAFAFALCSHLEGDLQIDHAGIGPFAFAQSNAPLNVVIGDGVRTIENAAFFRDSLLSLTIGASVDSIGAQSFSCHFPERITVLGTNPAKLGSYSFLNIDEMIPSSSVPLHIPCGSYDNYASSKWADMFSNITEVENEISVSSAPLAFAGMEIIAGTVEIVRGATCESNEVTVKATGRTIEGYHFRFDHWSNGSHENPYTFNLTSDTMLVAYFAQGTDGVDVASSEKVRTFTDNGQIVVDIADGCMVSLYDISGRLLASKHNCDGQLRFDVPASGAYIIKADGLTAKKIVIIK